MFYRLFRAMSRMVLGLFFRRIDVEGSENVPQTGPLLLVANHSNALVDPLVLLDALGRPVTLTAKNVLAKSGFLAFLMRSLGVITFHRKQDVGKGARCGGTSRVFGSVANCLPAAVPSASFQKA